nr:hypothetical protein [Halomicroarcula sp. YJ-61-S]
MSTTGRDDAPATAPSDIAGLLADATFVRLVSDVSGDALAGTGVLARALADSTTPFQASAVGPFDDPDRSTDADVTVSLGRRYAAADITIRDRIAPTAFEAARELGATASPTLALAGTIAAGDTDSQVVEAAERAGVTRRPGVAVPIADLADGLAHSTLLSAPFSGDTEQARAVLADLDLPAELDEDDHRRVASLVALAVTDAQAATPRAAEAVQGRSDRPSVAPSRRSAATRTCSIPSGANSPAPPSRSHSGTTGSVRTPWPRGAATRTAPTRPSRRSRPAATRPCSWLAATRCRSGPSPDCSRSTARRNQ